MSEQEKEEREELDMRLREAALEWFKQQLEPQEPAAPTVRRWVVFGPSQKGLTLAFYDEPVCGSYALDIPLPAYLAKGTLSAELKERVS